MEKYAKSIEIGDQLLAVLLHRQDSREFAQVSITNPNKEEGKMHSVRSADVDLKLFDQEGSECRTRAIFNREFLPVCSSVTVAVYELEAMSIDQLASVKVRFYEDLFEAPLESFPDENKVDDLLSL